MENIKVRRLGNRVKGAVNKKIFYFVLCLGVIFAFFSLSFLLWKETFIGEHIYTATIDKNMNEQILDLYKININDGKIANWKKVEYRDNYSFYILELSGVNAEKFFTDNKTVLSNFIIIDSCDFSKIRRRESLLPYIFYNGNSIKVVTTDLRNSELGDEFIFEESYSNLIARSFDDAVQ